jgi:hypothetical protein
MCWPAAPFRPSPPMDEDAVKVIHCSTCVLSCFYLSGQIYVCHACLYHSFSWSFVFEFLWHCCVVWLFDSILYVVGFRAITLFSVSVGLFLVLGGIYGSMPSWLNDSYASFVCAAYLIGRFRSSLAVLVGSCKTRDSSFVVYVRS